jgi:hypothetical protein
MAVKEFERRYVDPAIAILVQHLEAEMASQQ